jgi:hypothetical protein
MHTTFQSDDQNGGLCLGDLGSYVKIIDNFIETGLDVRWAPVNTAVNLRVLWKQGNVLIS